MQAIVTLFQLLDRGHEPLVGDDTMAALGCFDPDDLVRAGVLVPAEPTMRVVAMCGECGQHDVVRIERAEGIQFYEVCPLDGAMTVEPKRLRQWVIEGHGIADMLADSMASGSSAETVLPGKAWRIGDVQVGGESFPVVLTTSNSASRLSGRSGSSRMILVGDGLPCDGFAGCLSMTDAFDISEDGIQSRPDRFQQALPLLIAPVGNAFYRKGQMWVVRFNGEETYLENNVGPLYIARLLATPHRAVPAVTLLASRIGIDEQALMGSSGELADEQSVAECRDRYHELLRDISDAESNNDLSMLKTLQLEKEKLTLHFASVLGRGGKRREVGDMKKVSQSVSLGIKRTIDILDREMKPLADHLNASISRGITLMYSPPTDVDWLV